MKRLNLQLTTALLLAAAALPAAAADLNGFMPAAGEATLALSYTVEGYDEFFRGDTLVSNPGLGEVDTRSFTAWFRYGFTDRFAVTLNLPYVDSEGDGSAGFADSGVSDLTVLGHLRLAEWGSGARHSLTGAGGVRIEVGGYEGDAPVSLGDGSNDVLVRIVYQVEAGNLYFSQQVGYDWRSGDVPDGLPLHSELGYTFGRTTVNAFYTRYFADGGSDIGDPGFTFPGNQEEYERVGAKVYVRLGGGLGLTAAGYTTLDGKNTGDASGVSVGGVFGF